MKGLFLLAGALIALVAANLPWAVVSGGGRDVPLSGADVTGGLAQALALTLLAGWGAVSLLRGRARAVFALVLALAGLGAVAVAVTGRAVSEEAARAALRTVSLADPVLAEQWWMPALYGLGGALAVVGGVLTARAAARSSRTGAARFDRSVREDGSDWERLDAGDDPTLDGPRPGAEGPSSR